MARPTPTGCSPEQRGQRDRRISTKSHRPTGGETHPVKHWHAKQYQQTYGHCAGHIPRRVFVTSPRSCASERTQPPRACRPPTSCLIAVGASRRKRTRARTARQFDWRTTRAGGLRLRPERSFPRCRGRSTAFGEQISAVLSADFDTRAPGAPVAPFADDPQGSWPAEERTAFGPCCRKASFGQPMCPFRPTRSVGPPFPREGFALRPSEPRFHRPGFATTPPSPTSLVDVAFRAFATTMRLRWGSSLGEGIGHFSRKGHPRAFLSHTQGKMVTMLGGMGEHNRQRELTWQKLGK